MAKILLTGFEAYGNTPHNPAEAVALKLDGTLICGSEIVARIVPNSFFECIEFVENSIAEIEPKIIVMLG
ncbi:MAG: pyrrolidone-carboxylate peptidase, partial [Desulfobacterales bacterium]|nr:pyrrolidone-carboxylate peptidase [Desulfobacterales bacterium]